MAYYAYVRLRRGKAAEGRRSPKPVGTPAIPREREASWSAAALRRFGFGDAVAPLETGLTQFDWP